MRHAVSIFAADHIGSSNICTLPGLPSAKPRGKRSLLEPLHKHPLHRACWRQQLAVVVAARVWDAWRAWEGEGVRPIILLGLLRLRNHLHSAITLCLELKARKNPQWAALVLLRLSHDKLLSDPGKSAPGARRCVVEGPLISLLIGHGAEIGFVNIEGRVLTHPHIQCALPGIQLCADLLCRCVGEACVKLVLEL